MTYKLFFISIFFFSCNSKSNELDAQKKKEEYAQTNNNDTIFEPAPFKPLDCFPKLKTNLIKARDSTFPKSFGKVGIQYTIGPNKKIGVLKLLDLYVFRESDKEMISEFHGEKLLNKKLVDVILEGARNNLNNATINCKDNNAVVTGRVMMRVLFGR